MTVKQELVNELKKNENILQILPYEMLEKEWQARKGYLKIGMGYVAPLDDLTSATKMMKELGVIGKIAVKKYAGKTYVIFKGFPGQRKIITGTRYLANNPKVVRLAVGPKGVMKSVKGGFVLTAVLFVGIEVFNYFLNDRATLSELLGTISGDLIKLGISSICAVVAGLAIGSVAVIGSIAAVPLLATVAVGILVGMRLDNIDEETGATKALIEAYERAGINITSAWEDFTSIPDRIAQEVYQWEQHLFTQAIRRARSY
ncbi:MAG: hypothetical protein GY787_21545 [Alteromonadales bacterium]|nr:hypothetical protein [Alteromonadales bacterium]